MWDRWLDDKKLYQMEYELNHDTLCPKHPDTNPSCKKNLKHNTDQMMKTVLKNVILGKETAAYACKIMPGACDKQR